MSGLHVDFVQTEWLAGFQERVAKVEVHATEPHIERLILDALTEKYGRGDYFNATEPHGDAACLFVSTERVPFQAVASRSEGKDG